MQVKIKKLHPDAKIPAYSMPGDAALDLTAVSHKYEESHDGIRKLQVYGTGLAVEIPEGYVGLLFPRSSIANKSIYLTNAVGVLDSGFRGEITFKFAIDTTRPTLAGVYAVGDRIGQLMIIPYPKVEFVLADELSNSSRGVGGYGSTGS